MAKGPSPKVDAMRALREARLQQRGTTRERPQIALSTPVNQPPCDYRQPKTGAECVKDAGHGGHHKYRKPDKPEGLGDEDE